MPQGYKLLKGGYMTSLMRWTFVFITILGIAPSLGAAQGPLINEIMAGPSRLDAEINRVRKPAAVQAVPFLDEDGEASDWLEIINTSTETVNLEGFGLTDDNDTPYRWLFPATYLEPQEHLIVFTSGKDRSPAMAASFETIITLGDTMSCLAATDEPSADWNTSDFDDSAWVVGASPFGFGESNIATTVPAETEAVYLRSVFTITDITQVTKASIAVDYNDSFVAYINGHEVARANIGTSGSPVAHYSVPKSRVDSLLVDGRLPDLFEIDNIRSYLVEGNNILAVQVNNFPYSPEMSAAPFLTFGLASTPENSRGTPDWMIPYLVTGNLHTNFKISADGETVMLTAPDGARADSLDTGLIPRDHSLGRSPDGGATWAYYVVPTPGEANTTTGYTGPAGVTAMDIPGGFHATATTVTLTAEAPAVDIRYTIDGAEPTETSTLYTVGVVIDSTTVLRARAFAPDLLPGPVQTATYFIGDSSTIAVVSLSTDPANLWDGETGIHVLGNHYTGDSTKFENNADIKYTANYWKDWERPIHVELYEPDGALGFSVDAGIKIAGKLSRAYFQKSLNIFFRDIYGTGELVYKLFPDSDVDRFTTFQLRISGEDLFGTMFRDAMEVSLAKDLKVDIAGYRPALLFINGQFWGMQNIRERMFEDYIAEHHNLDPDNLDILEDFGPWGNGITNEGDSLRYAEMRDYILANSMSDSANYAHAAEMMDMESFADVMAAQFYVGNQDGPGHNMRYWRTRVPSGKFRWMLFDLDFGFEGPIKNQFGGNIGNPKPVTYNWFTDTHKHTADWWNPQDPLFPLNQLLTNTEFKNMFINRFADYLNTCFAPDFVLNRISTMKAVVEPEISRQIQRWPNVIPSMGEWHANVTVMSDFGAARAQIVREQMRAKFSLAGTVNFTVDVTDSQGGRVSLTTFAPDAYPWTGEYYKGVPMSVTAQPNPGWEFVGWDGAALPDSASTVITLAEDTVLTAVFKEAGLANSLIINEISYNPSNLLPSEDWIEFYNPTGQPVVVSGWLLKDNNDTRAYTIPDGTTVAPWGYLIVAEDPGAFSAQFPNAGPVIGKTGFGLGNAGDSVRLYSPWGALVDSVTYLDNDPWPTTPDGSGATLSLLNPTFDNTDPLSWAGTNSYGTPGEKNDNYVTSVADDVKPTTFEVLQNYPNPFNPETTIVFDLPSEDHVTVEVFSVLGQRVTTLVNTRLESGRHHVVFSGSDVAAGMYFYRVTAGSFSAVRRMVLMK